MNERLGDAGKAEREFRLERTPIMLNEHTVVLLTLFQLPHDRIDDIWLYDYVDAIKTVEHAASQFVKQLEDRWSPAFMIALRRAITDKLEEHDKEFGTQFAASPVLDARTVERCARVVEERGRHRGKVITPFKELAAAIRALRKGG